MEEEAAIAGGVGEAERPLRATAGESEVSGADNGPGGTVAGGGVTANATSAAADEVGAGSGHEARSGVRDRVVGRRENTAGEA